LFSGNLFRINARDILLGLNKSQEKKLSEWGFSVIISDVAKNNKVNPNQAELTFPQKPAA